MNRNLKNNLGKNRYYFQGTRFVPSYGDIDFDDYTVHAFSSDEAWQKLDEDTKMFTWSRVGITHINNVKLKKAIICK
jgi:hypothetical protein